MSKQDRDEAVEYVLRTVRESDVHFVRFWFTDILGNLKGFSANVAELENALERAVAFAESELITPMDLPPFLRERIAGVDLRVPATAFLQTNSAMCEVLYGTALKFAAADAARPSVDLS